VLRVRRKNYHLAFFRLKIVSCVSPNFITIFRTFERVQGTQKIVVKYLDSPLFMS
jgi:hypothetical protein